jgi:hypothetical protein
MNDLPADAPALAPQPRSEGWPRKKFFFVIAFAFALHVALISIFGSKQPLVPRAVTKVPHLQLADPADELIALGDPTLFARPNAHDFATAFWQRPQVVRPPEAPRFLRPAPEHFGADFRAFLRTNQPPEQPLNFKPEPRLIEPVIAFDDAMPQVTTMQIAGELARRRQLNPIELPTLAVNDVIAPSRVQVQVDPAGNIASAVLLPTDEGSEAAAPDAAAAQRALQLTRHLRFAPAPRLMFGEIIFTWHTVPVAGTNGPGR